MTRREVTHGFVTQLRGELDRFTQERDRLTGAIESLERLLQLYRPELNSKSAATAETIKKYALRQGWPKHPVGRRPKRPSTGQASCPECGKVVAAKGIGTHRRKAHGYRKVKAPSRAARDTTGARPRLQAPVRCPSCEDLTITDPCSSCHTKLPTALALAGR